MALQIICLAYQSMDVCFPFSLFGGAMRPYPFLRKQRRMDPVDLIDKIFDEMILQPSCEAACAKRGTKCCKQLRTSSSIKEAEEGESDTFTKKMMGLRDFKPEEIQIRVIEDKKKFLWRLNKR